KLPTILSFTWEIDERKNLQFHLKALTQLPHLQSPHFNEAPIRCWEGMRKDQPENYIRLAFQGLMKPSGGDERI
ncbi:hypothetical protein, partial [Corynebacterium casei]